MSKNQLAEQKKQTIMKFFNDPSRKKLIAGLLPKIGVTADKIVKCLFSAFIQDPQLMECTLDSLYKAIIQCSALGLEPNTPLQHCVLIPFGNNKRQCSEVQLIIEYRGWIALARRSENLFINADVIRKGDIFEFEKGTNPFLRHRPLREAYKNEIEYAYSVLRLRDGSTDFEVIPREVIDEHRDNSPARNSGPWVKHFAMMARKTAILVHQRYWPTSSDLLAKAAKIDSENAIGIQDLSGIIDIEATEVIGNGQEDKPKKGSLEEIAEKEERKEPPNESKTDNPPPREQLSIALYEFFEKDFDKRDEFLEKAIGKKILHTLDDNDCLKAMAKLKEKQIEQERKKP